MNPRVDSTSDFGSDASAFSRAAVFAANATETNLRGIPPILREPHHCVGIIKQKKATVKTIALLVLVVGLEPTCCHQHRILSPTRLPFHHTSIINCRILTKKSTRRASALSRASFACERHRAVFARYSTTPAHIC